MSLIETLIKFIVSRCALTRGRSEYIQWLKKSIYKVDTHWLSDCRIVCGLSPSGGRWAHFPQANVDKVELSVARSVAQSSC